MPRHLTPHPNALTESIKDKGDWNEGDGEKTQQTARPADAKLMVHCRREQRERSAERRPDEIVAGVDGSDVLRVRVAEIG